ncbi:MAG: DUF3108 domain-containing protein [candidate division WOR-3 bacterium]
MTARIALSTLLSLLTAALFNCGQTGQTTIGRPYQISVPPIPDGELLTYRVTTQGEETGRMVTRVRRSRFLEIPALEFITVTQVLSGSVTRRDSAVVYATPDSLIPIGSFHFQWVGNAFTTTAAKYQPGSVGVSTWTPQQGEMQRPIPLAIRSYDIDQLILLGRAFQVAQGKGAEIAFVIPLSSPLGGVVRTAKVTAKPDETVTVPAGTFECNHLSIQMGEAETELWLEKGPTRRPVKYQGPGQAFVMELISAQFRTALSGPLNQTSW